MSWPDVKNVMVDTQNDILKNFADILSFLATSRVEDLFWILQLWGPPEKWGGLGKCPICSLFVFVLNLMFFVNMRSSWNNHSKNFVIFHRF